MSVIDKTVPRGKVTGTCDPAFAGVLDAFEENFAHRDEVGACVHITVDGQTVVDLWGGVRNREGDPWAEDTLAVVFSCTKGASATCAHIAADRGLLDLDAPVASLWPEFAANGKEAARVSMM